MVVGDARNDPRPADNPMVVGGSKLRFHAGQPIAAPGGETLGTLCVFDHARDVEKEGGPRRRRRGLNRAAQAPVFKPPVEGADSICA